MKASVAALLALPGILIACQMALAQSEVKLPPVPSTIPPEVMYTLGQQAGLLSSISERLSKAEVKIDDLQRDTTRINTLGLILSAVLTAVAFPIVKDWIQQKARGKPHPT